MIGISQAHSNLPRLVRQAEAGRIYALARHGKTAAFIMSREWVESLLESVELMGNQAAMKALRDFKAGKTKFSDIEKLDEGEESDFPASRRFHPRAFLFPCN